MKKSCYLFLIMFLISISVFAKTNNINGKYIYLPEQSDDVHIAIDETVREMSFITRPIARRRLRNTNEPYKSIEILIKADSVFIATDGKLPIETNLDGSPKMWTREDGEKFEVSTVWQNDSLRQIFQADDGKRMNEYTANKQGLELKVTITSSKLKQPLTYNLKYQRMDDK